ncbi:MAG TPA: hypothetical protein VF756_30540 [Thermoanaerobaculia bacterium]
MNRVTEMELMRLLHGELPEGRARELRDRMERDPELAATYARLARTWEGLELPPAAPAPPGFAQRIAARAREQRSGGALSWTAAPGWVRAAAAAALVAGTALGVGAGSWIHRSPAALEESPEVSASEATFETTLAESYWDAIGELP